MKKTISSLIIATAIAVPAASHAELFINPLTKSKPGKILVEAQYHMFEADYIYDEEGRDYDVEYEKSGLSLAATTEVSPGIDAFGALYLVNDTELNSQDGDGLNYAAGLKGKINLGTGRDSFWYAQYTMVDEDLGKNPLNNDTTIEGTELSIGLVSRLKLSNQIQAYLGVEFTPLEDLEVVLKGNGGSDKDELERDSNFNIRLGAQTRTGLSFSAALAGEKSFAIGLTKAF